MTDPAMARRISLARLNLRNSLGGLSMLAREWCANPESDHRRHRFLRAAAIAESKSDELAALLAQAAEEKSDD